MGVTMICSIEFRFGSLSTLSCKSIIFSNSMKRDLVPSRYLIVAIQRLPFAATRRLLGIGHPAQGPGQAPKSSGAGARHALWDGAMCISGRLLDRARIENCRGLCLGSSGQIVARLRHQRFPKPALTKILCTFPRRPLRSFLESACWTSAGPIDLSRHLSSLQLHLPHQGRARARLRVDSNYEVLR